MARASRTRRGFGATATAVACLLGAVTVVAGQAGSPQGAPGQPPMAEDVFENIALLRGIPVDTFFDAMGMFANAMGNDCTYCHDSTAALETAGFAVQTPRMNRARQMIVMMNAINKSYFGGRPRVTCFTCHGGNQNPRSDPDLALQYRVPVEDPNIRDFPTDTSVSADQVFDRYLEAVGGAGPLGRLSSFVAQGTYSGFDTLFEEVPVEVFARAPNQLSILVHMREGNSVRVFDGRNGWLAGGDTPVPLLTLSAGNLDRARIEAMVSFPMSLRQAFGEWRVGRAVLGDEEVFVVQATEDGEPVANFYFVPSGLLARFVRWTQTPVGFVPTQVDYSDYREIDGVQIPFRRVVSQTYMQMTIQLDDVRPNVPIDAARFARPAPVPRPGVGDRAIGSVRARCSRGRAGEEPPASNRVGAAEWMIGRAPDVLASRQP